MEKSSQTFETITLESGIFCLANFSSRIKPEWNGFTHAANEVKQTGMLGLVRVRWTKRTKRLSKTVAKTHRARLVSRSNAFKSAMSRWRSAEKKGQIIRRFIRALFCFFIPMHHHHWQHHHHCHRRHHQHRHYQKKKKNAKFSISYGNLQRKALKKIEATTPGSSSNCYLVLLKPSRTQADTVEDDEDNEKEEEKL